jgi:phosphoribosylformylglycinamidine synthase PurS subunit
MKKNYKANIKITLREGILDVQGKTVQNSLHSIDFNMIDNVRIGKFVTLDVMAEDKKEAIAIVTEACNKLIANPIIEDYQITIEEI